VDASSNLLVYEVTNGVLGTSYSGTYGAVREVQKNALDWDFTNSYIAVGLDLHAIDSEVLVFHFDGASLTQNAGIEVGSNVNAVAWAPQSNLLAIGQSLSAERLRVYEHDAGGGTLIEKTSARVGDGQTIYSLDWSDDGTWLAVGKIATSATHELRIFTFDSSEVTLGLVTGYELGQKINTVAWSHDGAHVATGDQGNKFKVFELVPDELVFRNIKLFFKSDVTFTGPVVFEGDCLINGGGNIFDFAANGSISIASGGALLLEDATIRNIGANDIGCADDTAVITLRDVVWSQDSVYTFSVGALRLKNNIFMTGESTFVYASSQTSTLLANSNLELDVGFTFSYDAGSASKTLFELEDATSKLILDGATLHTTVTGMQLTKGKLKVLRDSFICSEVQGDIDEGITFGDGTASGDLVCDIFSGVTLRINQGSLNYRNVSALSWKMHNLTSLLSMGADTTLNLYESLDLGDGMLVLGDGVVIGKGIGKDLIGSIRPLGTLAYMTI